MNPIRWFEPRFDNDEVECVRDVILDNYINEGPKTKELEEIFQNYFGVKYVIMVANATAALFLAIKSEAHRRNLSDFEVIVPDMTMIATASAVNWAGGTPILVDVKKEDLTIDVNKIEEKITKKTIAIIPVHTLGRSADMNKILEISRKHNLLVIEDAAGALGSKSNGRFLGTIGDVGCFSLQSNKIITSGQGGIITTNNEEMYELMRRYRDFGRKNNKEFMHEIAGFNLKFNDLAAALALAQFKKLENRKNLLLGQYNLYRSLLENIPEINFFDLKPGEIPLWIDAFVKDRKLLMDYLSLNQVFCRPCWPSLHKNKPYQYQGNDLNYPISSLASEDVLWFPNGPAINEENIFFICDKIKEFYKK